MLIAALIIAILTGNRVRLLAAQETCQADGINAQRMLMLSTLTAYDSIRGELNDSFWAHATPDGCEPVHLWHLVRHGTSLPPPDTIETFKTTLQTIRKNIVENHKEGEGGLCAADLEALTKWELPAMKEKEAYELTQQGKDEIEALARRFYEQVPALFGNDYSNQIPRVRNQLTQHTEQTAEFYWRGILANFTDGVIKSQGEGFLRYYDYCPGWSTEVETNSSTLSELEAFRGSPHYIEMAQRVTTRLAYPTNITNNEIFIMYEICRYESAWKPMEPSPWCAVFTEDDFQVLEYMEDLSYFYTAGYGHEFNRKLGCALVSDLVSRFNSVEAGENGPFVIVYTTHLRAFLTTLTRLGVGNDVANLKGDNYEFSRERIWKMSQISPFAANLAAFLYRCSSGDSYRVRFFLNEKPVNVTECSEGELCPWKQVQMELNAESCDMTWCGRASKNNLHIFVSFMSVIILFHK